MKTIYTSTDAHGPCKLNISDNLLSLVHKAKATVDRLVKEETWNPKIEIPIEGYESVVVNVTPAEASIYEYGSAEFCSVIEDGTKVLLGVGEVYFSSNFLSKFSYYHESLPVEKLILVVEELHIPKLLESLAEYYKYYGEDDHKGYYPALVEAAKSKNLETLVNYVSSKREKLIIQ